ncbi:glutamine amidotransferase subunit pdxT [Hyaloraphidium curvatum]|nr:glutamine amidotransferase subunit pdxT [Hyaloraphidium curvatum]
MQASGAESGDSAPSRERAIRIGVLALQGAFREHINMLRRLKGDVAVEAVEIRTREQLERSDLDGLIIPGGESTTMGIVAERSGLLEPLRKWVNVDKKPVWGTCAGLILLANQASHMKLGGQALIGGLAVTVERNAFGSQIDSFAAPLSSPAIQNGESDPFQAVFIRAPLIETIDDESVETLAKIRHEYHENRDVGEKVVAVRQGHIVGTAFHPELTPDLRWHRFFVDLVASRRADASAAARQ